MDKDFATFRLGGSSEAAARWIGISSEVYREWPERLAPVMADRVYAAIIRRETARALGQSPRQFFADFRGELVIESMLHRVSLAAITANLLPSVPPDFARALDDEPDRPRKRLNKRTRSAQPASSPPTAAVAG